MATVDRSALSLEISRRFDAPPERVFNAWLGEQWAEWLAPAGAQCEMLELETRVGGRYLLRMTMPSGQAIEITGTYREILPAQRLVLVWSSTYNNQDMVLTVTFRPDGAGTMMTLRQEGFLDTERRDGYHAGWTGPGGSFDKLADLLARTAT